MGMPAVLGATSLVSGLFGSNAASSAGDTGYAASQAAAAQQKQMFDTINAQQQPYREAGYTALNQLGQMTAPGGQYVTPFTSADLNSYLAPNYQWQLGQGLGALNNQMNVTGGVNSGNTLKAINDYAQNFAGNAYQNAFNNYQTQQGNIFNRLSNIAGLGQASNQTTAQTGATTAANAGNALISGGQAQAAGIMGANQALTGGLQNAASWYALPQLLNG